jgi:hypothetical protein
MSGEQGFVARWSRRKSAERRRVAAESAPGGSPAEEPAGEGARPVTALAGPAETEGEPHGLADLPPLDSLTQDSDFAPFLRHGVPEETTRAALRKLWTSDPVWALPERLDIHNLDYTFPIVPQIIETAYRVGQGFLDATAAPAEPAAEPAPESSGVAANPGATSAAGESSAPKDAAVTRNDDTLIDQPLPVRCNDSNERSS